MPHFPAPIAINDGSLIHRLSIPIVGDAGDNLLFGGNAQDDIQGRGGNDTLSGLGQSDILTGRAGADVLDGGRDFDFAAYTGSTSVIVDLLNNSAAGGDAFGDSFVSIEGVRGSEQTDIISGTDGFNELLGQGGNDLLQGRGGSDNLFGGDGNDTLQGGGDDDGLHGGSGSDELVGGDGFDVAFLDSSTGPVTVDLGLGRGFGGEAEGDAYLSIEAVVGTAANDTLIGSEAGNSLAGGGGNGDHLEGRGGNDVMDGSGFLSGGGGSDTIFGGFDGRTQLSGGGGNDSLEGSGFLDTIAGGAGNDQILGGGSGDVLSGGAEADLFIYRSTFDSGPGSGLDTILDFRKSDGDRISLKALDADETTAGDQAFHFVGQNAFSNQAGELRFVQNPNNNVTILQADTTGDSLPDFFVKLEGLVPFAATDFVL